MKNIITLLLALICISCSEIVINKNSIFSGNFKKPDVSNMDFSGVTTKEHCKGWLYNSPSRRIVFTCTHVGPRVGSIVGFNSEKGKFYERKVVKVYNINCSMFRDEPLSKPTSDNFFNSDISICVLDEAVPATYKAYNLSHKVEDDSWVISYHQDNTVSVAHLNVNENSAIVERKSVNKLLIGGDSGLPWFDDRGNVVSHTTLINQGFGPLYTHPLVRPQLYKTLEEAEDYAISN